MLYTLHIAIDCHPKSLIQAILSNATVRGTGNFGVDRFGAQQENVGTGVSGKNVNVLENACPDTG